MDRRFKSFVIFAEMRTGSNYLESQLNAFDGLFCWGEVFNPYFIGSKNSPEKFGISLDDRKNDPHLFLKEMRRHTPGIAGYRFFHDHEPRILDDILSDMSCAKIILTRNPLESYVSWKIAQKTGQWLLTNMNKMKKAKADFDAEDFKDYIGRHQTFQNHIRRRLQATGQTAFYIDYEDLNSLDVINGLAEFLGQDQRLNSLVDHLKRQNPEPILEKVSNPDAMILALGKIDHFDLWHRPDFEPKRRANIPRLIVSLDVPLIYVPMGGALDDVVRAWMAGLGPHGIVSGLNQKSLRQWKDARPNCRSFTILRDPVSRSYEAFVDLLASDHLSDAKTYLSAALKFSLPSHVSDFSNKAQFQKAFVAFLRYLKLILMGQADQKVVPLQYASQTAVLQGVSTVLFPDLLLRQGDLVAGIKMLGWQLDTELPSLNPSCADTTALDGIWSSQLQDLIQEVYARDYQGFSLQARAVSDPSS